MPREEVPKKGGWGGRRAGAGRKKKPGTVPHVRREIVGPAHPVHVTVRANPVVGSLRSGKLLPVVTHRLELLGKGGRLAARRRTFRMLEFAVQDDHLHLIVEAASTPALSRGMQGLLAWLARDVNQLLGRRGQIFTQRFQAGALTTPQKLRKALVCTPECGG